MDAADRVLATIKAQLHERGIEAFAFVDPSRNKDWDPSDYNIVHLTPPKRKRIVRVAQDPVASQVQEAEDPWNAHGAL